MSIHIEDVEERLVSELHMSPIQAKVFLLIVKTGKKPTKEIAANLNLSDSQALEIANSIVDLGGFIDINGEFESMHPRFAVVNMYRRMCAREKIVFKKNLLVDNISIVLEQPYDDARVRK